MRSLGNGADPVPRGALAYCRRLAASSRSHFVLSFLALPGPRREGMQVVYAYCRALDDVADQDGARGEGRGARGGFHARWAKDELERWRQELRACAAGFPTHPIAVALRRIQRQFRIPWELFEKVLAGVEMDLAPRRYATFEELKVYCEHVASAVGLISIRVFGCTHRASERYADCLGIAFQLTNILRDLKEDAAAGRLYLPTEEMRRFGCSEEDLRAGRRTEAFRRLMAFQCARAREYFQRAEQLRREGGEGRKLLPARMMGAIYHRLLQRIEERDYDVFSERVRVSPMEQMGIALRTVVRHASCVLRKPHPARRKTEMP